MRNIAAHPTPILPDNRPPRLKARSQRPVREQLRSGSAQDGRRRVAALKPSPQRNAYDRAIPRYGAVPS